jgi:succinate dehydrogenase / fumarate reductase, cytochrome b subunit
VFTQLLRSTVGKKIVMAVTGAVWVGYLILHVAGNLQAFVGRDKINAYSALLHGPAAELLWLVRGLLIVSLILHVAMAFQLTRAARQARPADYKRRAPQVSTAASRTMRWGGVLLLLFIIFHVLHFTTRQVDPAGWATTTDAAGRYDIYGNVVASFRIWWVSAIYLAAVVVVGLHLWHGVWSFGRSLGVARPSDTPLRRRVAPALALAIWIGFSLVPLAVMAGVLK